MCRQRIPPSRVRLGFRNLTLDSVTSHRSTLHVSTTRLPDVTSDASKHRVPSAYGKEVIPEARAPRPVDCWPTCSISSWPSRSSSVVPRRLPRRREGRRPGRPSRVRRRRTADRGALLVWNRGFREGNAGTTVGKGWCSLVTRDAATGAPIGVRRALRRRPWRSSRRGGPRGDRPRRRVHAVVPDSSLAAVRRRRLSAWQCSPPCWCSCCSRVSPSARAHCRSPRCSTRCSLH